MSAEQKPSLNLIQKAAAVMAVIEHVPKNGRNAFHGYDYATESDIVAAVRKEMAKQGIMLVPSVEKVEWTAVEKKNGGKERLATLTVRFTLTDGADHIEFTVLGEGQDVGDKATYKAMTGALKYALLKLFLIPTGDDPELDDEKPQRGKQQEKPHTSNEHARAAVQKAAGKPSPIDAYKMEALKEATRLLGDENKAKAWLCGVREDPKAERSWDENDVDKVKQHLALLASKAVNQKAQQHNRAPGDEWGLSEERVQ